MEASLEGNQKNGQRIENIFEKGFSKLNKDEKIDYVLNKYIKNNDYTKKFLKKFCYEDEKIQKMLDEFSENTLTNFPFPFGVVPNVLINGQLYCVPMAIEESSVVAASAKAAKFWSSRGGFKAEIIDIKKIGQVHFIWKGKKEILETFFNEKKQHLLAGVKELTKNMEKRGGGLLKLDLVDRTSDEPGYYQLLAEFNTQDAMGANFINSILENLAHTWKNLINSNSSFSNEEQDIEIIMAILSNFTPECRVRCSVQCTIRELNDPSFEMPALEFVKKFAQAMRISKIDISRATTHNKGIFNGIDAVVIATGNDFRAVEACGHTYAARDGRYRGLSDLVIDGENFIFSLELPLSVGTVGGLTSLHPIAKFSLEMLGHPSAEELMKIIVTMGLAQNFAALRSLVTSGIQKGHMKMHLMNILNHLEATEQEREMAKNYFKNEIISFNSVRNFLITTRKYL